MIFDQTSPTWTSFDLKNQYFLIIYMYTLNRYTESLALDFQIKNVYCKILKLIFKF